MKKCARCHKEKEDLAFQICKHPVKPFLRSWCKQCDKEYARERSIKKGIKPQRPRTIEELPKKKKCTRCHEVKPQSEFRVKKENGKYWTLNPSCKKCDVLIAKLYYESHKSDEGFKQKNRERAKNYKNKNLSEIRKIRQSREWKDKKIIWEKKRYEKVKDFVAAKMKVKRQTPEYKAKMKAYRENNKEKIKQQEAITKKRYHEKHKNAVTDEYAIRQLVSQGYGTREEVETNTELIELKKVQILKKRLKVEILKLKKKDK